MNLDHDVAVVAAGLRMAVVVELAQDPAVSAQQVRVSGLHPEAL